MGVAACTAALLAAGCGNDGPTAGELVASAKVYLQQADTKSAMIQLRNARKVAPDDAEVRYLLGRTLLDSSNPVAAEQELRRALYLGYPIDETVPLVAQALLAQGDNRKLINEFVDTALGSPKARSALATSLAIAHLAQRDIRQGREAIETALREDPGNPRAFLVQAQLAAMGNDMKAAEAALDTALALAPNDPDLTVFKAGLLASSGRGKESLQLLERAAASSAGALHVRYALISMRVAAGQLDRAELDLEEMKNVAPIDFRTRYSEALIAVAKNDPQRASELTRMLTGSRPEHVPSAYLHGLVNYQLGKYGAAEDAMRMVIARVPEDPGPRRVLVATLIKAGRLGEATQVVDSALTRMRDDPVLLRLAGEARILTGKPVEAATFYERAAALERDASHAKLRLAQIRLATGEVGQALSDLARLSASDGKIEADLALFATHFRSREYAKAHAAVDKIQSKQPGTALPHELRGTVHASERKLKEARTQFAKALEIEPGRLSSARQLAMLDLQQGRAADARARYEKMIAADPSNDQPLIALAELLAISGAPATDVSSMLERAIAVNPTSPIPRVLLVAHHRRMGDNKAALEAARTASVTLPAEPQIVELLGIVQAANGLMVEARETYTRLAQLDPFSPAPLLRVAEASIGTGDYVSALDAQRKAIALQPDHLPSLIALATTYLLAGRPNDAITEARMLQRKLPKQAVGFALESELLLPQKKYVEAAEAMQKALERQPLPALAARHYGVLLTLGRTADAKEFFERWRKEHPKDGTFLNLVGQHRQVRNDHAGAISAYRAALALEPDNVLVLNNLAWLLNEQRKPEARTFAERAYDLAPLNADVVDTYGSVLLAQGDTALGLDLVRRATHLSPTDGRLRVSFAKALAKTGDQAGARRELERVVADARSPAKAEAEQLLSALR